jgi:hypothetical protein
VSAECESHGVDLNGDSISGLVCPACERDRAHSKMLGDLERLVDLVENHDYDAECAFWHLATSVQMNLGSSQSAQRLLGVSTGRLRTPFPSETR